MGFWMFLFAVFLALGLFLVAADVIRLPKLATGRALLTSARQGKKKSRTMEGLLMGWAAKLAPHLRMDEYKRSRLVGILTAAGLDMTPEGYTAYALVKAGAILLGIIPCFMVMPLLSPVLLLLAITIYHKESRRAEELLSGKREEIEHELPRFTATITQGLQSSRDVLSMIEDYKRSAGISFAHELDVLTADMRSGSYEAALTRFEARFGSPLLSDIVRGLIGVMRGDDGTAYFRMLTHDMKQLELQRLKAQAARIPPRIRLFSLLMLGCFILTYAVIIGYEIIHSMGGLF